MSAPAYESYKDSGVEWLGQVPSHWELAPIKAVASVNDEVLPENTPADAQIEYVEISDVQAGAGITSSTVYSFSDAPSRARRKVRDGDIIVSTVRTYLRAIGVVSNPAENLTVSTGFAVLRPQKAHSRYLGYALQTEETINQIIGRSVGISYPAINATDLVRIPLPVPTPLEQAAIAAFLDRETAKIDALIEAQTRLIELLKEKRQAVISHAVTKGLNPDAPMKDSGIEWLGQVPAHWEVKRLSYLFSTISSGTTPPSDNADYYDGEINWVTTGELREKPIRDTSKKVSQLAIQMFPTLKVYSPGTLLIAMYGATTGRLGWLEAPAATNQACCAFSDPLNTEPRYIYRYLQAVREAIILMATGGGQPNISQDKIRSLPTCSPPLDEQVQIAAYLDRELSAYDDLEAETVKTISLLQERRAALISAAVTGKIDVRGLVNIESEAA